MKNDHLEVAQQRHAESLHSAVSALGRIAESPELNRAVAAGRDAHGVTFLAFMALPGATRLRASEVLDAFETTYCLAANSLPHAIRRFLEFNVWQKKVDALCAHLRSD